ncbi:MAG TPA: SDR family oxidoreductase [Sphingopyxis sp.]|nr:SDR family oxidoreductase [Sphingopyxis sp.]HMP45774.1 SDR family oxidoreductase [Sphingopyxis sp.]HMQ17726.1 SDR family oxidoreductase [Sphingopyxis sp.]
MMLETIFGVAGQRVLIVGATPIGEASAAMFGNLGATAELADIVPEEAAIAETVAGFVERNGGIDLLVYAVTRIGTYALPTMALDQWDAVQDANLRGAFLAMRAVIPVMRTQGGGAIVAVSTMGSVHPVLKGNGAYGASKAGLNALVRAAALDHAEDGIRVNAVLPGAVPVGDPPADMERLGGPATQPGRLTLGMGSAEDIASAIVYLASPAGRFITGQALVLDGGFLIG